MVVDLGHRPDGGAAGAHRIGLVDCDGRGHTLHAVDRRAVHAVQELPRIGREGFDVAALPLGVEGVEDQAALAAAAGSGDYRHLAGPDVQVEILQIVLAGAANEDEAGGHGWG